MKDGLIRPAENPFGHLQGWDRFRNYGYIVIVHVLKAWDWDIVGFSHEYGYNCIPQLQSWSDGRMIWPVLVVGLYGLTAMLLCIQQVQRQSPSILSLPLILFVVHLSWMMTLFPISGVVKVGTFVADRLVVASSVSTTMITAALLTKWLVPINAPDETEEDDDEEKENDNDTTKSHRRYLWRWMLVGLVLVLQGRRVVTRTYEWMDSRTLLESSLRTCPNFAKAHLELSKVYSGLYPELYNLTRAKSHLQQASTIDPSYCDVHYQYAMIAIKDNQAMELEQALVQALQCPFTMTQAIPIWQQYWQITLQPQRTTTLNKDTSGGGGGGGLSSSVSSSFLSESDAAAAQQRYNEYMVQLQEAIVKEQQRASSSSSSSSNKSPFW